MLSLMALEVGKIHPHWHPLIGDEVVKFDFDNSGGILEIFWGKPTEKEIKEIWNGKIKVGICYIKNIIFLTFKFGTLHWMDVPYSVHLSKPYIFQELLSPTKGYAILTNLVDSCDGTVKALRLFAMPPAISQEFKMMVEDQKKKPFDKRSYDRTIMDIYRNFSTKDLVSFSKVRTIGDVF